MKKFQNYIIFFLGIFFIASAISKLFPIQLFEIIIKQILDLPKIYIQLISRFIIAVEISLGIFYLIKFNLRSFTLPFSIILLIFFNFILTYQIAFLKVDNCGCLGNFIPMSPETSLIKNFILLIMIAGLLFYNDITPKLTYRYLIIVPIIFSFVFAFFPINYLIKDTKKINTSIQNTNLTFSTDVATETLKTNTKNDTLKHQKSTSIVSTYIPKKSIYTDLNQYHNHFDVNEKFKILLFLSLDCNHCMDISKQIASYLNKKNSFIYFLGDTEDVPNFLEFTKIKTNYIILQPSKFFSFVDNVPPKIFLLYNGNVLDEINSTNFDLTKFQKIFKKYTNQ